MNNYDYRLGAAVQFLRLVLGNKTRDAQIKTIRTTSEKWNVDFNEVYKAVAHKLKPATDGMDVCRKELRKKLEPARPARPPEDIPHKTPEQILMDMEVARARSGCISHRR